MQKDMLRSIINAVRNSWFHSLIANILEKFQMEGFSISYSQGGEDLIIKKLIANNLSRGLYVDIGCNNPIQNNNTYKLYQKGWSGICVDGNAKLIENFKKIRPKDICLTEIISDTSQKMTFYQFDSNHEMSTLVRERGDRINNGNYKEIEVVSKTLEQLFDQYMTHKEIDFLCVDVEEHDLQVLKGNNFSKYRPKIICVEQGGEINWVTTCPITQFLNSQEYHIVAFCSENIYFKDSRIKHQSSV